MLYGIYRAVYGVFSVRLEPSTTIDGYDYIV